MRRFVAPLLFAVLLAILLLRLPIAFAARAADYEWFDPLIETRRILSDRFVEPIDDEAAFLAAIDGFVGSLGDPYTEYIPPADEAEFTKSMRGEYAGIGAEVRMIDGDFTIISPMAASPALAAGVRAGDVVLEIDGTSTDGLTSEECIELLVGPVNTEVAVLVRHEDGTEERVTITRQRIVTRTVRGLVRQGEGWTYCLEPEHGLRYVRLTQFNANSARELAKALQPEAGESFEGLILDLRDNPGGGLPTAIEVANLFIEDGLIVRVQPRNRRGDAFEASQRGTVLPDTPMVILINGASASASEIVAGALQAAGRAKVLGTRTFGKGSVQEVRQLEYGGGTLKYTIAEYELATGRSIHRRDTSDVWGVDPDPGYVLPVSDGAYRDMLLARRDFEVIRETDAERGDVAFADDVCWTVDGVRREIGDEQLAVAAESLIDYLLTGQWPSPGGDDAEAVTLAQEQRRIAAVRNDLLARLEELDARLEEIAVGATDAVTAGPDADVDLTNATITIRTEDGVSLGSWAVEGTGLRTALRGLELVPADAPRDEPTEAPAASPTP